MNSTAMAVPARSAAAVLGRGPLLPVAIAWAVVVLLLRDTFVDMWRVWGASGTFTHGYVIFPIALFLLWNRRARWRALPLRPNVAGFLLVAAAVAVWLVGTLLHLNVVMQYAAVGVLVSVVVALVGFDGFRTVAFPLLFMFFAVPAGEELVPWLMDFTARFTVGALNAVGVPVFSEGRLIYIPTGNFSVEKACSGIRYLIASIVLGTLFAHFFYRTTWRRLLFVALCVVVPVLANGVRAFLIVILAHLSNNEIAIGIDHLIYGWIFFGAVMLLMFWIGRRFSESRTPAQPVPLDLASTPVPSVAVGGFARLAPWIALVALLVPVFGGRIAVATLQSRAGGDSATAPTPVRVPAPATGWTGPITISGEWAPRFFGPTRAVSAGYLHGVNAVDVAMLSYVRERAGAELINSENRLFDPERWTWLGERSILLALPDGQQIPVLEVRVREGLTHRAIWRIFVVGDRAVSGGMQAKLQRARALMQGGDDAGVAVIVSAALYGENAAPEREVREFVVHYYTLLLACLRDDEGSSAACVPAP